MIKEKSKRLILKTLICLMIVIVFVGSVFLYRTVTRKVLDVSVVSIKIDKANHYDNYAMNEQQKKTVNENPNDYIYVDYMLEVKNESDKISVENINIQPEFFGEMKKNVFWFDYTDEVGDYVSIVQSSTTKHERRIVVKRNGLSDDDLIEMAKSVKFKLTYNTYKGNSILSYCHNSQVLEYKEN